jgi:hypothetical protein
MPNLRPFRDYSEHDVINIFSCTTSATKGTLVKPVRSWKDSSGTELSSAGPLKLGSSSAGASYSNVVANLFDIVGTVSPVVNYDDAPAPLGIILNTVAEYDENGERLINNPRKAIEMGIVLPNVQAVPILTKGLVYINDIDTTNRFSGGGNPDIGDFAYVGDSGKIATDGTVVVGKFLSKIDENGYCLVKLNM